MKDNSKKKLLFALLQMIAVGALSQDIEVKKFVPNEKDHTAMLSPRKDINRNACGLVKVQLKEPGAEFEGSVMGDVQFMGVSIWCGCPTDRSAHD